MEPDFTFVECEEAEASAQKDLKIIKVETIEYDEGNSRDQSKFPFNICGSVTNSMFLGNSAQATDDEDQSPRKKRKSDVVGDSNNSGNQTPSIDYESGSEDEDETQSTTQCKKEQEAAQIREFFNTKCEICKDVEFETLIRARKHYRKVHNKSGYITCCGKRFDRRHKVMDHIKYHLNPEAFRCDLCDRRFKNNPTLKLHIASHERNETDRQARSYQCELCQENFPKPSALAKHKQLKHGLDIEKKFSCEKCNKKYVDNNVVQNAFENLSLLIDFSYPSKYALATHIRGVHESAFARVCDICARVCRSIQAFRNHMQEHAGIVPQKVQCNVCGAW